MSCDILNMISKNEKSQSFNNCCFKIIIKLLLSFIREGKQNQANIPTQEGIGAGLMTHGTRESKILGRGRCFVRFSYFMYVTFRWCKIVVLGQFLYVATCSQNSGIFFFRQRLAHAKFKHR